MSVSETTAVGEYYIRVSVSAFSNSTIDGEVADSNVAILSLDVSHRRGMEDQSLGYGDPRFHSLY